MLTAKQGKQKSEKLELGGYSAPKSRQKHKKMTFQRGFSSTLASVLCFETFFCFFVFFCETKFCEFLLLSSKVASFVDLSKSVQSSTKKVRQKSYDLGRVCVFFVVWYQNRAKNSVSKVVNS